MDWRPQYNHDITNGRFILSRCFPFVPMSPLTPIYMLHYCLRFQILVFSSIFFFYFIIIIIMLESSASFILRNIEMLSSPLAHWLSISISMLQSLSFIPSHLLSKLSSSLTKVQSNNRTTDKDFHCFRAIDSTRILTVLELANLSIYL